MALHAHTGENVSAQRQMARYWEQRDAERGRRDLSKIRPVKTVESGRLPSVGTLSILLQATFIKFDQIEIRPNIVATFASRFFEKMEKARIFCSGVRMSGNHRLIPLFDCFGRMSRSVFLHPV